MYRSKIFEKLKRDGLKNSQIYDIMKKLNDIVSNSNNQTSKSEDIVLCGSTFFSSKSGKVVLRFCPLCGSTKILNQKYYVFCESCGNVLEENY